MQTFLGEWLDRAEGDENEREAPHCSGRRQLPRPITSLPKHRDDVHSATTLLHVSPCPSSPGSVHRIEVLRFQINTPRRSRSSLHPLGSPSAAPVSPGAPPSSTAFVSGLMATSLERSAAGKGEEGLKADSICERDDTRAGNVDARGSAWFGDGFRRLRGGDPTGFISTTAGKNEEKERKRSLPFRVT